MDAGFPKKIPYPIDQSCVGYWKFDKITGAIQDLSGNNNTGAINSTTYTKSILDVSGNNNHGSKHSTNLNDLSGNANHGTKYSTNLNDISGNNNHGTIYGATRVAGKINQALSFNGSSYVDCGNSTSLNITDDITLEAWINTAVFGTSQYRGIVGRMTCVNVDGCSYQYGLSSQWSAGNTVNFWVHTEGTTDCANNFTTSTVLSLNTWYHIVGTYSSTTGDRKIYVNGVLDAIRNTGAGIKIRSCPNQPLNLGRSSNGNWYFNGLIDGVCIYNRVLSPTEITSHYNNGLGKILDPTVETGLVGYYRGDTVANVPGKLGCALIFDGIDDYVNCGDINTIDGSALLTVEGWVKAVDTGSWLSAISKLDVFHFELIKSGSNGTLNFITYNYNPAETATVTLAWSLFQDWHHIVATFDGSNVKLYVNGVLRDTKSRTNNLASNSNAVSIGNRQAGVPNQIWKGFIDSICIYNRTLSAIEIIAHYNNGLGKILDPLTESGLVGYWRGDVIADVPGKLGHALKFDGVDDYVDCGNAASLNLTSAITLEAWVKPSNLVAAYMAIISKYDQAGSNWMYGYSISVKSTGNISFFIGNGSYTELTTISQIDTNWHHIVGTWSPNNQKIYIDGILSTSGATQAALLNIDGISTKLGEITNGTNQVSLFNGLIDDVRIYNRALSQTEVTTHYNSDTGVISDPATETGLIGYWRMGSRDDKLAPGKFGPAMQFNGVDDYVDFGNNTSLQISNTMTIEFWIKPNSVASSIPILAKSQLGGGGWEYNIQFYAGGKITFESSNYKSGNTTIIVGNWYHVVVVISGGNVYFYLNGQVDGSSSINLMSPTSYHFYIGYWYGSQHFNGIIDEARIYNRALSPSEIKQHYMRGR